MAVDPGCGARAAATGEYNTEQSTGLFCIARPQYTLQICSTPMQIRENPTGYEFASACFVLEVPAADGQWPPLRGALPVGAVQAGMMARDKTSPAKGRGTARKGGGGVRSDDRVLS